MNIVLVTVPGVWGGAVIDHRPARLPVISHGTTIHVPDARPVLIPAVRDDGLLHILLGMTVDVSGIVAPTIPPGGGDQRNTCNNGHGPTSLTRFPSLGGTMTGLNRAMTNGNGKGA